MNTDTTPKPRKTDELLEQILEEVQTGNAYLKASAEATAKTATNTKNLRQDVRAIREGKTNTSSLSGIDPLTRAKREEVNRVKELIREHRKSNPCYSLLSVSKFVRKESARLGRFGGYETDIALNSRASTELKREENGLNPY